MSLSAALALVNIDTFVQIHKLEIHCIPNLIRLSFTKLVNEIPL